MDNDLSFETDTLFKSASYDSDTKSWSFSFDNHIGLNVSGFWRLLANNKIILVSSDHGQRFGLPTPVNLSELIEDRLNGKNLIKINVKKDTADLLFTLTDDYQLQVFIASTGYETYHFGINGVNYIGLGSGNLAFY